MKRIPATAAWAVLAAITKTTMSMSLGPVCNALQISSLQQKTPPPLLTALLVSPLVTVAVCTYGMILKRLKDGPEENLY